MVKMRALSQRVALASVYCSRDHEKHSTAQGYSWAFGYSVFDGKCTKANILEGVVVSGFDLGATLHHPLPFVPPIAERRGC